MHRWDYRSLNAGTGTVYTQINNCYNLISIKSKNKYIANIRGAYTLKSDSIVINNCYYIESNKLLGDTDEIHTVQDEDAKKIKFVEQLNSDNDKVFKLDTTGINNGYPILYWQTKPAEKQLIDIHIKNPPEKVVYKEGERFDTKGMVIIAIYSDDTSKEITTYRYIPHEELTVADEHITISYKENEVTKIATQEITVEPIKSNLNDEKYQDDEKN